MRVWLGLGANLGDPVATLHAAKARLAGIGTVTAASSLYRTPPWGVADQPPFVNAALVLETPLGPEALLAALKLLERTLGRVASIRWGPRAIDIDILDVAPTVLSQMNLPVPPDMLGKSLQLG